MFLLRRVFDFYYRIFHDLMARTLVDTNSGDQPSGMSLSSTQNSICVLKLPIAPVLARESWQRSQSNAIGRLVQARDLFHRGVAPVDATHTPIIAVSGIINGPTGLRPSSRKCAFGRHSLISPLLVPKMF